MISNLFEKKWFLILFSITLSVFLWYYVILEVDPSYTNSVEITRLQTPGIEELTKSGFYVENDLENMTFTAKVSGKRSLVTKNYDNYYVELDLSKIESAGVHQTVAKVVAPPGVTVKHLSPELIEVKVGVGENKIITPNLVPTGSTADLYELSLVDSEITISGKPSAIEKVAKVEVRVDCDKIRETGTEKYKVNLLDSDGNEYEDLSLTVSKEAEVNIRRKKSVDIKITSEPSIIADLRQKYDIDITVEDKNVSIAGLDEDLRAIDYVEADISKEFFSAAEKEQVIKATLIIPDNLKGKITFASGEDRFANVTIKYTLKKADN